MIDIQASENLYFQFSFTGRSEKPTQKHKTPWLDLKELFFFPVDVKYFLN